MEKSLTFCAVVLSLASLVLAVLTLQMNLNTRRVILEQQQERIKFVEAGSTIRRLP